MADKDLIEWADAIDSRLGPISGGDADALAAVLRRTAARIDRFAADRNDHDRALRDAIRETAQCADELAFWKYQAIFGRAVMLDPDVLKLPLPEESRVWKVAERQLETARAEENRELEQRHSVGRA